VPNRNVGVNDRVSRDLHRDPSVSEVRGHDTTRTQPEAECANDLVEHTASEQPAGIKHSSGSSLPVELTRDRSAEYEWADRIKSAWQKSVESIIECGRLLIEAKAALRHGRFESMVEAELLFGLRTAERLMEIANDTRLTNPTHVSLLPPHWGTLHVLTQLDDDEFQKKLDDRVINPGMTRADAKSGKRRRP
jgi:hypothetical protein